MGLIDLFAQKKGTREMQERLTPKKKGSVLKKLLFLAPLVWMATKKKK